MTNDKNKPEKKDGPWEIETMFDLLLMLVIFITLFSIALLAVSYFYLPLHLFIIFTIGFFLLFIIPFVLISCARKKGCYQ